MPTHPDILHWDTVSPYLKSVLLQLMQEPLFDTFRLVGGTALSLQAGHRLSVDIDLFTDSLYGTIDFERIDAYLHNNFAYVWPPVLRKPVAMGTSYTIGADATNAIKLDLFHTDPFIHVPIAQDGVRMADANEILAMKMDVILHGGRKKDFWDVHAFIKARTASEMQKLHSNRYPYNSNENLKGQLTNFDIADGEPDPVCLKNKNWQIIKLDITEWANETF